MDLINADVFPSAQFLATYSQLLKVSIYNFVGNWNGFAGVTCAKDLRCVYYEVYFFSMVNIQFHQY